MACVAYWNKCEDCKKETYDRSRKHRCEDCNGEIYSVREFHNEKVIKKYEGEE